jgi:hypothetical protein
MHGLKGCYTRLRFPPPIRMIWFTHRMSCMLQCTLLSLAKVFSPCLNIFLSSPPSTPLIPKPSSSIAFSLAFSLYPPPSHKLPITLISQSSPPTPVQERAGAPGFLSRTASIVGPALSRETSNNTANDGEAGDSEGQSSLCVIEVTCKQLIVCLKVYTFNCSPLQADSAMRSLSNTLSGDHPSAQRAKPSTLIPQPSALKKQC